MSLNKNALIRYKTIDACLQNRYRKWTLEALIEATSDALYEYEGIRKGVSRRTVQMDIQFMRSDKLGYNAPIVVLEKKYYTYEDPKYSITNIPLTQQDLVTLNDVVVILQQFKGFSHFREVDDMVNRLQHKVYTGQGRRKAAIDFEKNVNLVGLEYIEPLYQAITARQVLKINYRSFKSRNTRTFNFHPHMLKEYRNRWFILGLEGNNPAPMILPLDRIKSIEPLQALFRQDDSIDTNWFDDIVGVTRYNMRPQLVRFRLDPANAPYVRTKPIHASQVLEETLPDGSCVFCIQVIPNPELERELLGFGGGLEVLAPARLREQIKTSLMKALQLYDHQAISNQDETGTSEETV